MTRFPLRIRLLAVVVAVQVVALVGIAMLQGARIASGTIVRVAVHPADPIDLARGSYSDLAYAFDELSVPGGDGDAYVLLKRPAAANGVWRATAVTTDEGRLDDADAWIKLERRDGALDTGSISTYYASSDAASDLDKRVAHSGGIAKLSLDEDGDPTLIDVTAAD